MKRSRPVTSDSFTRLNSIEAVRSGCLRVLYDYWLEIRGDRIMPSRADFDPGRVVSLLPLISLMDVIPNAPPRERFVIRLFGTALVERYGADWTGKTLFEKMDEAAAARVSAAGEIVVQSREPWISTGKLYWVPNKNFMRFEVLMLPLSEDTLTVNKILAITETSF